MVSRNIKLSIIITIIFFAIDLLIPLGVAIGVIYALPILLTYKAKNNKLTILFALLTSVLIIAGYYFSPSGGELWKVVFNRAISILIIWGTALGLLTYFKLMNDALRLNKKLSKNNLLLRHLKSVLYETNSLAKVGSWEINMKTMAFFCSDTIKEIIEVPLAHEPRLDTSAQYFKEGESRETIVSAINKAVLEGTEFDVVTQAISAKGKELWLRAIGKTEVKEGKCIRCYGSLQDITKEKLLERKIERQSKKIKESEEKFRGLFEKSGDAILLIVDGLFTECNQATVNMLEYDSKEEFLNTQPSELSPPVQPDGKNSVDKANEMINLALENGTHRFEWIHTKKNGKTFPVEVLLTAISKKPDTEIIHTVWRDITERKNDENKLKLALVENKDIKIALDRSAILAYTDKKGKITYVNDKFIKISKYSKEELIGADHRILNSGYHSKEFMKNLWATILSGKIWQEEVRNKAKDGSFYWVQTIIVPSVDEKGEITKFINIRYVITDRKEAEESIRKHQEELENKNKELEKIVWYFSHKVRAPVATIMGLSNIFNYKNEFDQINKDVLSKIQEPINSLEELISEIVKDINNVSKGV